MARPKIAYSVSDLQQKVDIAKVGDLVHAHNILNLAKKLVENGHRLKFLHLPTDEEIGMTANHVASFMGQPNEASQQAHAILLSTTKIYEGKTATHLIDWGSSKIHRKIRSTLSGEGHSAARAFERACYARTMQYDISQGLPRQCERQITAPPERKSYWEQICQSLPLAFGTDCKSLYDVCNISGSLPNERRVALDILDMRESLAQYCDIIRWVPTDHRLVDGMTKNMNTDMMTQLLDEMVYSLKYVEEIKDTKHSLAKARTLLMGTKKNPLHVAGETTQGINFIKRCLAHLDQKGVLAHSIPNWKHEVNDMGYRQAYLTNVEHYCQLKDD